MIRKHLTSSRVLLLSAIILLALSPVDRQSVQAATFMVTNTNDSGPGSLRQAIIDANNNAGTDTISFDIPDTDPGYSNSSKVWEIRPNSLLPSLTDGGTIIGGRSQTINRGDTNVSGPEVQLDASNLGANDWLFSLESDGNRVSGLAITNAGGAGVRIRSASRENIVADNYIGVDPSRLMARGNGTGVEVFAAANNNTISSNVISGNDQDGIKISDTGTDMNTVRDNIIGLNASGETPIPNGGHGIAILSGAAANSIGGLPLEQNIVSGNGKAGVYIHGIGADSNIVWGNFIGTTKSGTSGVGNTFSGVIVQIRCEKQHRPGQPHFWKYAAWRPALRHGYRRQHGASEYHRR